MLSTVLNVEDVRRLAHRRLPRGIFDYIDRGAEDEVGLARLRRSFDEVRFHPRVLVDVSRRDLSMRLFGHEQPLPLVIALTAAAGLAWHQGRDRARPRRRQSRHSLHHRHGIDHRIGAHCRRKPRPAVVPALYVAGARPLLCDDRPRVGERHRDAGADHRHRVRTDPRVQYPQRLCRANPRQPYRRARHARPSVGLRGEEGVRKLVAMLQVMRAQMGSSEEAASSMSNIFAKMESQETAKRFTKFGVNLRKEMAQARREGKDLLEVFIDLAAKATKGDLSKIRQLFSDMDFARGMRSLLAQREQVGRIEAQLKNSAGSVAGALSQLSGDTMTELDRLSNKWQEFVREIGALTAASGVGLMEGILQDIRIDLRPWPAAGSVDTRLS